MDPWETVIDTPGGRALHPRIQDSRATVDARDFDLSVRIERMGDTSLQGRQLRFEEEKPKYSLMRPTQHIVFNTETGGFRTKETRPMKMEVTDWLSVTLEGVPKLPGDVSLAFAWL